MSRCTRHQQFAYAKTKTHISCAVTAQQISVFVFATQIVQALLYLNPTFKLLACFCDCTSRFVSYLVGIPDCWFSHAQAHVRVCQVHKLYKAYFRCYVSCRLKINLVLKSKHKITGYNTNVKLCVNKYMYLSYVKVWYSCYIRTASKMNLLGSDAIGKTYRGYRREN